MNGYNYLLACLKECNKDTVLSFNGYHLYYRGYTTGEDSITIILSDNRKITITRDSNVFSEYSEAYNILTIEL